MDVCSQITTKIFDLCLIINCILPYIRHSVNIVTKLLQHCYCRSVWNMILAQIVSMYFYIPIKVLQHYQICNVSQDSCTVTLAMKHLIVTQLCYLSMKVPCPSVHYFRMGTFSPYVDHLPSWTMS